MRIVYDASARVYDTAPSLNECLESGPPLQNQLWKVLVRGRFNAVSIAGDIRKAFLQVHIRAEDRDALRFHWISGENPEQVRTLRFTRALFGLGPSPFFLGESFSITSTSSGLTTLIPDKRLNVGSTWTTC